MATVEKPISPCGQERVASFEILKTPSQYASNRMYSAVRSDSKKHCHEQGSMNPVAFSFIVFLYDFPPPDPRLGKVTGIEASQAATRRRAEI